MRNINSSFKKKGSIEYMVEINIYYQGHEEEQKLM